MPIGDRLRPTVEDFMGNIQVALHFTKSFAASDRLKIQQIFNDERIRTSVESDLFYKGAQPQNLIVDIALANVVLRFLQGYVSTVGLDAWEATKRALRRMRSSHDGGQEIFIVDETREVRARYILPSDPSQQDAAISAISEDFAASNHLEERWWLGPPEPRWGSGLEAAQQGHREAVQ